MSEMDLEIFPCPWGIHIVIYNQCCYSALTEFGIYLGIVCWVALELLVSCRFLHFFFACLQDLEGGYVFVLLQPFSFM